MPTYATPPPGWVQSKPGTWVSPMQAAMMGISPTAPAPSAPSPAPAPPPSVPEGFIEVKPGTWLSPQQAELQGYTKPTISIAPIVSQRVPIALGEEVESKIVEPEVIEPKVSITTPGIITQAEQEAEVSRLLRAQKAAEKKVVAKAVVDEGLKTDDLIPKYKPATTLTPKQRILLADATVTTPGPRLGAGVGPAAVLPKGVPEGFVEAKPGTWVSPEQAKALAVSPVAPAAGRPKIFDVSLQDRLVTGIQRGAEFLGELETQRQEFVAESQEMFKQERETAAQVEEHNVVVARHGQDLDKFGQKVAAHETRWSNSIGVVDGETVFTGTQQDYDVYRREAEELGSEYDFLTKVSSGLEQESRRLEGSLAEVEAFRSGPLARMMGYAERDEVTAVSPTGVATSVKTYDVAKLVKAGVPNTAIKMMGFSSQDIAQAHEVLKVEKRLSPYKTREGYDLVAAIQEGGETEASLQAAGFSAASVGAAQEYIEESQKSRPWWHYMVPGYGTYLTAKERGWKSGWTWASLGGDILLLAPAAGMAAKGATTAARGTSLAMRPVTVAATATRGTGAFVSGLARPVVGTARYGAGVMRYPTQIGTRTYQAGLGVGRGVKEFADISTFGFRHPLQTGRSITGMAIGQYEFAPSRIAQAAAAGAARQQASQAAAAMYGDQPYWARSAVAGRGAMRGMETMGQWGVQEARAAPIGARAFESSIMDPGGTRMPIRGLYGGAEVGARGPVYPLPRGATIGTQIFEVPPGTPGWQRIAVSGAGPPFRVSRTQFMQPQVRETMPVIAGRDVPQEFGAFYGPTRMGVAGIDPAQFRQSWVRIGAAGEPGWGPGRGPGAPRRAPVSGRGIGVEERYVTTMTEAGPVTQRVQFTLPAEGPEVPSALFGGRVTTRPIPLAYVGTAPIAGVALGVAVGAAGAREMVSPGRVAVAEPEVVPFVEPGVTPMRPTVPAPSPVRRPYPTTPSIFPSPFVTPVPIPSEEEGKPVVVPITWPEPGPVGEEWPVPVPEEGWEPEPIPDPYIYPSEFPDEPEVWEPYIPTVTPGYEAQVPPSKMGMLPPLIPLGPLTKGYGFPGGPGKPMLRGPVGLWETRGMRIMAPSPLVGEGVVGGVFGRKRKKYGRVVDKRRRRRAPGIVSSFLIGGDYGSGGRYYVPTRGA